MRQTTGIIFLEILTGAVLFTGMVIGLIAWRLVSGPTSLDFIKPQIEQAIAEARGGRDVTIGQVTLLWLSDESKFQIIADDLSFLSDTGEEVGGAERALIDLNAVSLLSGQVELSELVLEAGELRIERTMEGEILIADQVVPPVYPLHFHEASTPLQYVEQSLLNIVDNIVRSDAVNRLQRLSLRDFRIILIDEGLDVHWEVENAVLNISRQNQELTINARGDVFGDGAPKTAELNASLQLDDRSFSAAVSFLEQSVPEFPLFSLLPETVTGRLSADLTFQFDMDAYGILQLAASLNSDGGQLKISDREIHFGENDITIFHDVRENLFLVDAREVDIGPVQGQATLELPDAQSWIETPFEEIHPIRLISSELKIDLTPIFETPWSVSDVSLEGDVNLAEHSIGIARLSVGVEGGRFEANGEIYRAKDPLPGDLPLGIRLNAESSGTITPATVLHFWPVKLGDKARDWVQENVLGGRLFDAQIILDIKPDSLRDKRLNDEDIRIDFSFTDGEVSFLEDLPAVQEGSGEGRLTGNGFSLDLDSAVFSNWTLGSGTVQIPHFVPKGGDVLINARGRGAVVDLLRTIDQSRLQLSANYRLDIDAASGSGEATFSLRRPLLAHVDYEDTLFSVEGQVRDGGFRGVLPGLDLEAANAALRVDNETIQIVGYGEVEGTPVQFDWSDRFRSEGDDRTRLKASGLITPDLLNQFGIAVRAYLSGDVAVKLDATGASIRDLLNVTVDFDLTENRVDLAEFGWVKQQGEAANARLNIRPVEGHKLTTLKFNAEGCEFIGDIMADEQGLIDGIRLERFYLRDQLDLHGELNKTETGGLAVDVSGPYLNGAPFLDGMFQTGEGALPVFGDVSFRSKIDKLDLREGFSLQGVDLALEFSGPDLQKLSLEGTNLKGGEIRFGLTENDAGKRELSAYVGDAGGLFSGLFGMSFVEGGILRADGVLGATGEATELLVTIKDARLKRAPLLTQILSLASLRGLTDVMSGEGVLFTDVRLPLRIDERGFYLKGVKASGPAMGLTANGYILDNGENIAMDGVLVPSFGVNSALGGIPIIGDLFVSREGEGVFAITYSVRGSLAEARISVNPLSGLLPGVLRRIFENPADEPIPLPTDNEDGTAPGELTVPVE